MLLVVSYRNVFLLFLTGCFSAVGVPWTVQGVLRCLPGMEIKRDGKNYLYNY